MENRNDDRVYAAWSVDDDKRLLCTSGGLFYELACKMTVEDGAVVACSYTEDYRGAYHCVARTLDEIIPQCGSKHIQSQTLHIYREVRQLLESGVRTMFVGTPCQVAALYSYLGDDPENLITVDFICNSINSPKAQAKYIDYLEEVYGARITFSRAKDKRYGWNNFGSSAKFENGREYYADRNHDARVKGYHHGHLFIRESCLDCKYKVLPRNSDLTLGDFWGIEDDIRNPKKELGTSVVIANSNKGASYLLSLGDKIEYYEKAMEDVLRGNPALLHTVTTNGKGGRAFAKLDSMRFDKVVDRYMDKPKIYNRAVNKAKKIVKAVLGN
jgi:coenzyme F420-reducing hydrogenase beta subunit